MRTLLIIYLMTLMTITGSPTYADNLPLSPDRCEVVVRDIVLPFLDALKNGDVDSIKLHIAGDIYENRRVLLEKNKEYPEFLRNYYHGLEFYIENVMESGDYIVVHLEVEFANGEEGQAQLYLCKDMNDAPGAFEGETWKIVGFRYQ